MPSLDRLSRSLKDLVNHVADLAGQNIGFMSVHENPDTTPRRTAGFHVFALAKFVREIIVHNTNEGLAAARARVVCDAGPTQCRRG